MKAMVTLMLLLALTVAAGPAAAHPVPQHHAGQLLADNDGYTFYTYEPDGMSSISRCDGSCAAVWPPCLADPGAKASGDFTLVRRDEGTRQWVYKRQPLYLLVGDAKPGDRDGDGINGSRHLAG